MAVTRWTHLLLLCLCTHREIRPAACKPVWMRAQFPCDVRAYNNSKVLFDCEERRLHMVPYGITANATELNLSENHIGTIWADSFSRLSNLTRLNLSWANKKENKTVVIAANAFKNLTKLQCLILTGIGQTEIPENLPLSLKILNLNMNKITWLENGSFNGLTNVTKLMLSKNCFSGNPCGKSVRIGEDSFAVMSKLQHLDLSFNNLTKVPVGLPKSLIRLELGRNQIQAISKDDFLSLPNLNVLRIQGNCPRCQNALFPCVPCHNGSLSIHLNAFKNLKKLKMLNLGGNSLEHLNPSWFESLSELKKLFLSFNFLLKTITDEATFLRHLPKLELVDISFNFALQFYPRTINLSKEFSKLSNLRTLHLEGLVFQNIEPDTLRPLYGLYNLSALNLGTNFIIHSDSNIFKQFRHLKMIYLAENRLYPIPVKNSPHVTNGYHRGSDLSISLPANPQKIDSNDFELSHSLIKDECFDSGRVLILSSNNLFFITREQFQGYGDIACLNLSSNGFSAALNGTEFSSLPNLTYLDLSFNKIDLAYDNAFKELRELQVLDLSHNDHYFKKFGITLNLNFIKNLPVLRVLNMSHNSISRLTTKRLYSKSLTELQFTHNLLGTLWKKEYGTYEMLFTNLINLTILDISHNSIKNIPYSVYEYLPPNLTMLHVNHNLLTDFRWDKLVCFHQLQILDLSFNNIPNVTSINLNVSLTYLDLSHNKIFHLDNGFLKGARSLSTLILSNNKLTIINESTFQSGPESQIQTLFLQGNPFQCTCDSLDFIVWIENSDVKIPRLTSMVTCETPANMKGSALIFFGIDQCVNDSEAFMMYILTNSFIVVFMCVATLAHLFYWDASYVLHYMKAKLTGYRPLNSADSVYGVFVTYDTRDPHVSEWVMTNLRVKLEEEGDMHLPLCLEERDWPPGAPLVENLSQSIRHSSKTLFVLTEAYIKTGRFKLAMFLAHQRLLDENRDVIVLLMLEPVLQHSHFLRLRKRMCRKSVLQWPRTPAAEPWFWTTLRNVVRVDNQAICNKTYKKYFTIK
ncbi:toll-like receptor 8 [Pungitius pungitius]|uniref:toll-like receptor 8 n=1 Tax=Pungitius pungitius TaxID=134920 RepID=UPI002E14455F